MKPLTVILLVLLVAGGGYGLYTTSAARAKSDAALKKIGAPMVAEIGKCEARLKLLHDAWAAYRKDHKGAEPPSFESLVPKYVKTADLFMCPSYERLRTEKRAVNAGRIKIGGKDQDVTYGFRWLTSSNAMEMKRKGEAAPLISCTVHQEALARYVYGKDPLEFAPSPQQVAEMEGQKIPWQIVLVQRDGQIKYQPSF
jgi:hypothetical protein